MLKLSAECARAVHFPKATRSPIFSLPSQLTMSSSISLPSISSKAEVSAPAAGANTSSSISKPKPCCVCKDEKASRDDCMLFSKSADPMSDCKPIIDKYKSCMAGFGFQI